MKKIVGLFLTLFLTTLLGCASISPPKPGMTFEQVRKITDIWCGNLENILSTTFQNNGVNMSVEVYKSTGISCIIFGQQHTDTFYFRDGIYIDSDIGENYLQIYRHQLSLKRQNEIEKNKQIERENQLLRNQYAKQLEQEKEKNRITELKSFNYSKSRTKLKIDVMVGNYENTILVTSLDDDPFLLEEVVVNGRCKSSRVEYLKTGDSRKLKFNSETCGNRIIKVDIVTNRGHFIYALKE
jgi:hypothetical protein